MSQYDKSNYATSAPTYPPFDKAWITKGITTPCIEFAEKFGRAMASGPEKKRLTTSQLRNFFGEVRRIQMKGLAESTTDFLLLRPKLAYAAARSDSGGHSDGEVSKAKDFDKEMQKALEAVNPDELTGREQRFQNFCDLLEAILAYHKVGGGK